jgi:hypothetical protein
VHETVSACKISKIGHTQIVEQVDVLAKYFEPILWWGVKGNFIIKTLENGKIDTPILNETFSALNAPVVFGNNKLITQTALNNSSKSKEVK